MLYYFKQFCLLLLEVLLYVIISVALIAALFFLIKFLFSESDFFNSVEADLLIKHPIKLLALVYIPFTLCLLISSWITHCVIFKRPEIELGYTKKNIVKHTVLGGAISLGIIVLGFLILIAFDQIDIIGTDYKIKMIGGFFLLFCVQSLSEEIIFRAYLIPTIERRLGIWAALIISSLGFMLIHLGNNNVTGLAIANLVLGGVLMGLLFIKYRNIWAPTGMHIFWNYIQSTILGFEVSGEKTYSFLLQKEKGIEWITGGEFGYEGSIISVVLLCITIILFWKMADLGEILKFRFNKKLESIEA